MPCLQTCGTGVKAGVSREVKPTDSWRQMSAPGEGEALSRLEELRRALELQVTELATRRQDLEAQLEALGGKLEEVDTELEAKRRMLTLVEATEQELGQQLQAQRHESGPEHDVRGNPYGRGDRFWSDDCMSVL
jgi:hypothetical protein